MTSAKCKFDWLKTKGMWGAKSSDNEKIVGMTAALNALKGQLSWIPSSAPLQTMGTREATTRASRRKSRRTHPTDVNKRRMRCGRKSCQRTVKNKKNTFNQCKQKKDETWMKEPPTDNEKKEKQVGKYTYYWCEHHMVWTAHKPAHCMQGK